jgi:hypothetical protein
MDKLKELELDLKACLQMVEGIREGRVGPYLTQLSIYIGHANRSYEGFSEELSRPLKG